MEQRVFGRTNKKVSILTIGGFGLGNVSQEKVDLNFKKAMDAGINMIDIAPSYGNSEINISSWVKKYRNKFFLAEKTTQRTKEGAKEELEQSLKNLGTDHFDLYQFHAVKSVDELQTIFGKNGAMETFLEARDAGIIKYIGLTGHNDIRIHLRALEMFDFDVLLLPVNITSIISPDPVNNFKLVLKEAVDRNIGITAIKAIQKSRWTGEKKYETWYEPFDDQESINETIQFTLSQEGVTTYSLAGDTKLWDYMLTAGKNFKQLTDNEQKDLIEKYRALNTIPLFPYSS